MIPQGHTQSIDSLSCAKKQVEKQQRGNVAGRVWGSRNPTGLYEVDGSFRAYPQSPLLCSGPGMGKKNLETLLIASKQVVL